MNHRVKRAKRRLFRKRTPQGAPPGTLSPDPSAPKPTMRVLAYGPTEFHEAEVRDIESLRPLCERLPVVWLNVDGVGDVETMRTIGSVFGIHRLALADIVNANQRPKIESYDENLFIVARMVEWTDHLETDQLSLFLGPNFVVTFQEKAGDCFDGVRQRIRTSRGLIRTQGPDYLAYALLDATIDAYFPVLERIGENIEALEDEILSSPHPDDMAATHDMKRDLLTLRRAVWPMREAISTLLRDGEGSIRKETRLHLNDSHDHTVQLLDLVETYREIASSLVEMYLSSMSHRLNEVMKVLTIIATIFIPLTFVAGVYGMNFDPDSSPWNMPELRARYGYPLSLAAMALVAAGLLYYFRRKGWIGSDAARRAKRRRDRE
ncbi:MAG: magnesium/cobalt transporter CorA [Planctomycetota bacterium]